MELEYEATILDESFPIQLTLISTKARQAIWFKIDSNRNNELSVIEVTKLISNNLRFREILTSQVIESAIKNA